MPIKVETLFIAVSQQTNSDENGQLFTCFNPFLEMAELAIMDWLTGKLDKNGSPFPAPSKFLTQKNKDFLSPFIVKKDDNFKEGIIAVPKDYYTFESLRVAWLNKDCDSNGAPYNWHDVTLLNSDKVANRLNSSIAGIKPTEERPIAERIATDLVLHPENMDGQHKLIYIRYPKFGKYVTKIDTRFNDAVYDEANSSDLEWEQSLMNYFVDKIMEYFSIRNGAVEQFQMGQQTKEG